MKLTLARDPLTMWNRMQSAMTNEDLFDLSWDDTQMDMYEEGDKVVIRLKAPGFDEKNIDISVENNTLTITGNSEYTEEDEGKNRKYYRKEIRKESFTRSVSLPTRVKAEEAEAKFKNGVLELTLPKAEEVKPKKITISAS